MKKTFFILIPAIFLGILFFGLFQHFVLSRSQKGALQVTSTPQSKVYLNDKYIGQTPLCKCEAEDTLKTGDYTLRLIPQDNNTSEYQEKITISEGVLTVIDRKFGKDSTSSGSVISLSPLADNKKTELLVVSIPSKSKVYLDNNQIGETPYLFKNPTVSDHALRVVKEGYEEKTVRIRTPEGYKLTVVIYLSTGSTPKEASPSPSASPSAALTPTPQVSKITILNTPTGFLRVRASASIVAAEVGRVVPTESFDLVSEQTGWFQIRLKNGAIGWISSQYAARQ